MSDESPFASFVPSTEATPAPTKPKKERKKKAAAPKATKVVAAPAAPASASAKPKKERKVRAAKKPRALMLPIATLLAIGGLNDAERAVLSAIVPSLQAAGKKSRQRITHALAKIFS